MQAQGLLAQRAVFHRPSLGYNKPDVSRFARKTETAKKTQRNKTKWTEQSAHSDSQCDSHLLPSPKTRPHRAAGGTSPHVPADSTQRTARQRVPPTHVLQTGPTQLRCFLLQSREQQQGREQQQSQEQQQSREHQQSGEHQQSQEQQQSQEPQRRAQHCGVRDGSQVASMAKHTVAAECAHAEPRQCRRPRHRGGRVCGVSHCGGASRGLCGVSHRGWHRAASLVFCHSRARFCGSFAPPPVARAAAGR